MLLGKQGGGREIKSRYNGRRSNEASEDEPRPPPGVSPRHGRSPTLTRHGTPNLPRPRLPRAGAPRQWQHVSSTDRTSSVSCAGGIGKRSGTG